MFHWLILKYNLYLCYSILLMEPPPTIFLIDAPKSFKKLMPATTSPVTIPLYSIMTPFSRLGVVTLIINILLFIAGSAILRADAVREQKIREAEGEAQAILKIKQAEADGIKMIKDAEPTDAVVKIKSLEAFAKAADGQSTKIIIPFPRDLLLHQELSVFLC